MRVGRHGDHAAAIRDGHGTTVEDRVRRDEAFLERTGDRDNLEDGAGLVDVRHRAVTLTIHRRGLRVEETVEVVGRPVGEAEDAARARLAHNDDSAFRIVAGGRGGESVLAGLLDEAIDRQHDGAAVDRRDFAEAITGDLAAASIAFRFNPTLLAEEERVHHALNAGSGDTLLIHEAEYVRGELTLRIVAPVLQFSAERLDAQRLDPLHRGLVDLMGENGPADCLFFAGLVQARSRLESLADLGERQAKDGRNFKGAVRLALDERVRVHADIPNVIGHRQKVFLRVTDLSAAAWDLLQHAASLQGFRS